MPKVFAIVPAAGQGTRIGDAMPKQYLPLAGKPMMFHSIEALAAVSRISCVCVVLSPLDHEPLTRAPARTVGRAWASPAELSSTG